METLTSVGKNVYVHQLENTVNAIHLLPILLINYYYYYYHRYHYYYCYYLYYRVYGRHQRFYGNVLKLPPKGSWETSVAAEEEGVSKYFRFCSGMLHTSTII